MNKLTELQIKQAKGTAEGNFVTDAKDKKQYRLHDGGGLALVVAPTGSKYWQYRYKIHKKSKTLSIGAYPLISLKEAREARDKARKQVASNVDPNLQKQADKLLGEERFDNTFEKLGRQWIEKKSHEWSEDYTAGVTRSLEKNIFPYVGNVPVTDITTPMLRKVLDRVQNRGSLDMSMRLSQRCSGIFRYGRALGVCNEDPASFLKEVLKKHKKQNYPALHPNELSKFLDDFDDTNIKLQTRLAIKLIMLTFVRNSELGGARWAEIDLDNAIWVIPAERMKKKDQGDHDVPLSRESIGILKKLHTFTGHREHVFPNERSPRSHMTDATMTRVIHRMGYSGRMTIHGFRSIASSVLNESGEFNPDAIERQLHHKERNAVRAAYNRAEYLEERTKMMQWWADWVVQCRTKNDVLYRSFA